MSAANAATLFGSVVLIATLIAVSWAMLSANSIRRRIAWDGFFARPLAERRAMRREIEATASWRNLVFRPLAALGLKPPPVDYQGTKVPPVCTAETMAFAHHYRPGSEDVFVATQMKCGTTWMQQIVYEVLMRGAGDLSDAGHRHMYALSPWIESEGAVRFKDAPLVGDPPRRIVKTHLATDLCPYAESARYIYVARHPAACLASCKDFMTKLFGVMAPAAADYCDWFCSDDMFWRSWPEHVDGWWRWSETRDNVLFVHYEALLDDLPGEVRRVAEFLGVALTEAQLTQVVAKCGFDYMKAHSEYFEMSPPTPLDAGTGAFFASGSRDRDQDTVIEERERVAAFCRARLQDSPYPLERFYPDVAGQSAAGRARAAS